LPHDQDIPRLEDWWAAVSAPGYGGLRGEGPSRPLCCWAWSETISVSRKSLAPMAANGAPRSSWEKEVAVTTLDGLPALYPSTRS